MKYIKTFDDKDNSQKIDYSDISIYIREEIDLGKTKPHEIENSLYKSGDYICSSFKIDDRDVIVSSIVINDSDTICVNGGRQYNTLGDYISQFGLKTDKYLYIGFGEWTKGLYNGEIISDFFILYVINHLKNLVQNLTSNLNLHLLLT